MTIVTKTTTKINKNYRITTITKTKVIDTTGKTIIQYSSTVYRDHGS